MSGSRLPVTVIGGYLGTGKTTLVNHLLRSAGGRRLAVLVNDFGTTPIDRDLILAAAGDTLEISGGCVCCSYGSDLMDALLALPTQRPDIERVVLETSGVALPGMVASAVTLLQPYRVDGIVVVADAETVRSQADDAYIGDTITRQLAAADIVVLNRCDLVDAGMRATTLAWLAGQAPEVPVVMTRHSAIAPELVLGLRDGGGPKASVTLHAPGAPDAASLYDSAELEMPGAIDIEALGRTLTAPGIGILRAKGILLRTDGTAVALHVVGRRFEIDAAPQGATPGKLVVIGLRGQLDRALLPHGDQSRSGRSRSGRPRSGQPRSSTSLRSF